MSRHPRRRAAVLATAVAAGTLALPVLAQPASAADPTTEVQVILRASGTGPPGIYSRPAGATDASQDKVLVPPSAAADYSDLTSSADGSRFAYVAATFPAGTAGDPVVQIVVRDISGNLVRVVEQVDPRTSSDDLAGPALSPDGNTVAWERAAFIAAGASVNLRKVAVAGGTAVNIPGGSTVGDAPTFLNAGTLAFTDRSGVAKTLPVGGGTPATLTGVDTGGPVDFEVSPDGLKLAWALDTTPASSNTSTYDVKVADLNTVGTPSVSGAMVFATGADNEDPSFSANSADLSFVKYDGDAGPGDVWTGPVDRHSVPVATPTTTGVDELQVDGGNVDTVAPTTAPTPGTFTLGGTSATVRWTLPADADVSGVKVTRNGTDLGFRPGTSFTDTGLTLGTTYSYTFAAVDRSGNAGTASIAKNLVATAAPSLSVADPTARVTTGLPFLVRFAPTGNKTGTTYDVYYRPITSSNGATTGSFTRWVTTTGTAQTFGYRNNPVTVTAGSVYQLRGAARDTYGNATGYVTAATKAVVPFDQTKAAYTTGVASGTASDRYLGSVRILSKTGQHAVLSTTGDRLQILGERSTSGGTFDVYRKATSGGTYARIARNLSTYATTRQVRQTLFTSTTPQGNWTYDIRWTPSTTTHKLITLDAYAVRR